MDYRRLGSLSVPAVGFGAMVLSPGLYGSVDDDLARRALMHAIDVGSSFFDTSDGYGPDAHNERLIGATIAGRRDEVIIASKFGYRVPPHIERHPFEVSYGTLAVNAEPQNIRGYALASVERLRTDHIDLYYPHFPDPLVPIEETVGAMAALVDEGLVRHLGLSNVSAEQLEVAVAVHTISAVQCEWSLWTPIDPDLLAVADRHDVGLVAWSPLGGGFLTGTLNELDPSDFRNKVPRLAGAKRGSEEGDEGSAALHQRRPERRSPGTSTLATRTGRCAGARSRARTWGWPARWRSRRMRSTALSPVKALATELALSPSQLALAWLLHQHPCVVPIPGSRTAAHIAQNAATAGIALTPEILERIDGLREQFHPEGGAMLAPYGARSS